MRPMWYLSADMQFFIISPGLVYLIHRFKKATFIALLISILCCVVYMVFVYIDEDIRNAYVHFITFSLPFPYRCTEKASKRIFFVEGVKVMIWCIFPCTFGFPRGSLDSSPGTFCLSIPKDRFKFQKYVPFLQEKHPDISANI